MEKALRVILTILGFGILTSGVAVASVEGTNTVSAPESELLVSASGESCSVIDRFTTDIYSRIVLGWDGQSLWVTGGWEDGNPIYRVDELGNTLSYIMPPTIDTVEGIAYDGSHLWVLGGIFDDVIYKVTKEGEVVDTIPEPSGLLHGLAWDGEGLWTTDMESCKLIKINPATGRIMARVNAPFTCGAYSSPVPWGVAWDGARLWVSGNNGNYLYAADPKTGRALHRCEVEYIGGSMSFGVYGLAWNGRNIVVGSFSGDEISVIESPYDPEPPTVSLAAEDGSASEQGANPGVFKIHRGGDITQEVVVKYSLSGSAKNGTDYKKLTGRVKIGAGKSFAKVTIKPKKDKADETTESVIMKLLPGNSYKIGSSKQAAVKIRD